MKPGESSVEGNGGDIRVGLLKRITGKIDGERDRCSGGIRDGRCGRAVEFDIYIIYK